MRKISFFANIAIELTLDVCKILLGKIEAMTSASNENKEKELLIFKRKLRQKEDQYKDLEKQLKIQKESYHRAVKDNKKLMIKNAEFRQM